MTLAELQAAEERARKLAMDTVDFTYAPVDPTEPMRLYRAAVEARVREQVAQEPDAALGRRIREGIEQGRADFAAGRCEAL